MSFERNLRLGFSQKVTRELRTIALVLRSRLHLLKLPAAIPGKGYGPGLRFDEPEIQDLLSEKELKQALLHEADELLAGRFCLLHDSHYVGQPFPWHQDPVNSYTWPKKYFRFIKLESTSGVADIKRPWELSRFQFLPLLCLAHRVAPEKEYGTAIAAMLENWLSENQAAIGVNWRCSMDVALRLHSWILCHSYLSNCSAMSTLLPSWNRSISFHGEFLLQNLENDGPWINNHYLANLVGLLYWSLFLKSCCNGNMYHRKGDILLAQVLRELRDYLEQQFGADGSNCEGSLHYHLLVCELFASSVTGLQRCGLDVPRWLNDGLCKMMHVIKALADDENVLPGIGDSDSSRVVSLFPFIKHASGSADALLHLWPGDPGPEKARRLAHRHLWGGLTDTASAYQNDFGFPDAGLFKLKKDSWKVVVRCGKLSLQSSGGHAHNDQLSIVCWCDNIPLLIDPGSGSYTENPELRQQLRSSSMHSTLHVTGEEQNPLNEGLFRLRDTTQSTVISSSKYAFAGKHHGFQSESFSHTRMLSLEENAIIGSDSVTKLPKSDVWVQFMLHPTSTVIHTDRECLLENKGVKFRILSDSKALPSIDDVSISMSYGTSTCCQRIRFLMTGDCMNWSITRIEE